MPRAIVRTAVVLLIVLAAAAAALVFHYVPLDVASFAAWGGIAIASVSLLFVLRPPLWLGLRGRRGPLVALTSGLALALVAVIWPSSVAQAGGPRQRLDDFLPQYQFREYHEAEVQAPVERVIEAVRLVSFADMPAAVWLMRLRDLAGGRGGHAPAPRPILESMTQPGTGFLPLDVSNPREIVYGMVGRPWTNERPPRVRTPEEFLAFTQPGQIRVAFNIRIVELGQGRLRVSTETRTLGNDPATQRVFTRYWRIIYPGSAIIRRVWLDAIVARARSAS